MSRFSEEVRIIPRAGWALGILAYLVLMTFLICVPGHDPEIMKWPTWGRAMLFGLAPLPLIPYGAMIGYVYADARRRGMRYVMWTLLAIFIPNFLGIILYFVLREPAMIACPHCGTRVKSSFAFCPSCGSSVGIACPQCHRPVEPGWSHCAACGTKLGNDIAGPSAQPHS